MRESKRLKMSEQDKLKSNAEYQRRSMMTSEERARSAIEKLSQNIHEQNTRDGKHTSYDSALRKATEIAHTILRKGSKKKGK